MRKFGVPLTAAPFGHDHLKIFPSTFGNQLISLISLILFALEGNYYKECITVV